MINQIISFVYIVGGLKLLFESRKKHNIYLSLGFILLGVQYLLNIFIIEDALITLILNTPRILGSFCLMMSPFIYLRGDTK